MARLYQPKRGDASEGMPLPELVWYYKGQGSRRMALPVNVPFTVDANGLPISLLLHLAHQAEVTLVYDLVQNVWTEKLPERVIIDQGYASDSVDAQMADCGIEMIASHKKRRVKLVLQPVRI